MSAINLFTRFGLSRAAGGGPPSGDAYTYYRLAISANNRDTYVGLGELQLYDAFGGSNKGTGSGTATASAVYSADVAANAFDGDIAVNSANWRALWGGGPQWIQKQFDATFALHHYAIVGFTTSYNPATRSPRDWALQGSNDGSNWDTLDTRARRYYWTQAERREFDPANPDAYYRLLVTANNGDSFLGVCEVELYASIGGAAIASPTVEGDHSGYDGSNPGRNAWNGNSANNWRVTFAGGPQWVSQIFPSSLIVAQYGVRNWNTSVGYGSRAPKDWKLQRSTDGITWSDLHTVTGETGWSQGELRKFTI